MNKLSKARFRHDRSVQLIFHPIIYILQKKLGPSLNEFLIPLNSNKIIEKDAEYIAANKWVLDYFDQSTPKVIDWSYVVNIHNNEKLKANYIDKGLVKFIYREVYFDKYGMWASMIARCAGPEKFFGMTDQITNPSSGSGTILSMRRHSLRLNFGLF